MISLPSSSRSGARDKPAAAAPDLAPPKPRHAKWRTGAQAKIYSRRLASALDAARAGGGAARAPVIKAAADSALAFTARGQSRWSRAILASRVGVCARRKVTIKAGGKIRHRIGRPSPALPASPAKEKKVRERLRTLGRLVPGCRKVKTPELLEEAADYVAALELQVKAMKALADALSAATVSERETTS